MESLEQLALELKNEQAVILIEIVDGEYRIEHLTGEKSALYAKSEESRAA